MQRAVKEMMRTSITSRWVRCSCYKRTVEEARERAPAAGPKQAGFTLAELLLVVVVIVLVAGVGGGICVGTYKRLLTEKAARDFVLAAECARIQAIELQRPCMIEVDPNGGRFGLFTYGLSLESEQTEQVPVWDPLFKKPVELPGGVVFEAVEIVAPGSGRVEERGEQKTIIFLPNGTANSAVVQIGDGKNHMTVSICAATGRPKLYVGTAELAEQRTIDLDEQWGRTR